MAAFFMIIKFFIKSGDFIKIFRFVSEWYIPIHRLHKKGLEPLSF